MKKTMTALFLCLLFSNAAKAQELISDKAFDKLVIQDVTYTIFGESTPVAGIKVDISKPEASLSGIIPLNKDKSLLLGLDFKGGITDKNFSIFKGHNSFNTAFEFKPSLHIIPGWNSAKYPSEETPSLEMMITRANLDKDTWAMRQKAEDDYIVAKLLYDHHFKSILSDSNIKIKSPELTANQKKTLIETIKSKLNIKSNQLEKLDENSDTKLILDFVPIATKKNKARDADKEEIETYNEKIYSFYKVSKKQYENIQDEIVNKEIEIASTVWTKKNLMWFTISPFARTEKVNMFHTQKDGVDSLYFKKDHPFYYGINGSFNYLMVYPNKIAHYFKAGINLSRSNNIATLNSFTYNSTTPFFNTGTTITEKIKTGVAYNDSEFKNEFLGQFVAEYYLLPLKSFIPGVYVNTNLNYSNLYNLTDYINRENDKFLLGAEGGLIFNINDKASDQSILSICMYTRFEDVTDSKRTAVKTNIVESKSDYLERNLSFGIKVGIPISLPKRTKM